MAEVTLSNAPNSWKTEYQTDRLMKVVGSMADDTETQEKPTEVETVISKAEGRRFTDRAIERHSETLKALETLGD